MGLLSIPKIVTLHLSTGSNILCAGLEETASASLRISSATTAKPLPARSGSFDGYVILKISYHFFLLCVHGYYRLPLQDKPATLLVDVFKLGIPVRMRGTNLQHLLILLKAVPHIG